MNVSLSTAYKVIKEGNARLEAESYQTLPGRIPAPMLEKMIERYLLSIPSDGNVKKLIKQMELAKKELGEKRVEFFEKEEGYLYDKIGEGVYQRKR